MFTNVVIEDCRQTSAVYIGPGSGHNSFVNCSLLGGVGHGVISYAPQLVWIGGQIASFVNGYGILAQAGKVSVQGLHSRLCTYGIGAGAGVSDISVMGSILSGCTTPLDISLAGHSTALGNL